MARNSWAERLNPALGQFTEEIEREIAKRELASRARAVLQSRYGMSEGEAPLHLRLVIRKSRKRLRDVAREVLDDRHNPAVDARHRRGVA